MLPSAHVPTTKAHPPRVRCKYCRKLVPAVRWGNMWRRGKRVTCGSKECRRELDREWIRERQRRRRAEVKTPEPTKAKVRACANCGRKTTNRMLCPLCYARG